MAESVLNVLYMNYVVIICYFSNAPNAVINYSN